MYYEGLGPQRRGSQEQRSEPALRCTSLFWRELLGWHSFLQSSGMKARKRYEHPVQGNRTGWRHWLRREQGCYRDRQRAGPAGLGAEETRPQANLVATSGAH